jgi:hypothetical protein
VGRRVTLMLRAAVIQRLNRRLAKDDHNLSFEEWIEHAFSHEVRIQQAAWYFDPNHDLWDPNPLEAVAYLTRLFEDSERTLFWSSDDQIAQGLTYLVGTSASGDNGWLSAMEVPIEARVRCVEGIGKLFDRLFAPRCHRISRTLVRSGRAGLTAFVICGGTNFHASHCRATRTRDG